jgi:hypothetical protein
MCDMTEAGEGSYPRFALPGSTDVTALGRNNPD